MLRCACNACGVTVLLIALPLLVSVSYAQSLGDVAREQRQKQQSKEGRASAKKVVTDEDMPAHADSEAKSSKPSHEESKEDSAESSGAGKMTAEQWKARILTQKQAVAAMQKQVDKLAGSIHFVPANAYRNGAQYNKLQVRNQEKLHELQEQLEEQKTKLEEMQENARQAGFGNAVYDPE